MLLRGLQRLPMSRPLCWRYLWQCRIRDLGCCWTSLARAFELKVLDAQTRSLVLLVGRDGSQGDVHLDETSLVVCFVWFVC